MNSYKIIDIERGPRRELFEFYRKFASPAFNITVSVNAENIYCFAKDHGESFFLISLYAILRAANIVPQVRQRIIDNTPVEFEKIAAMTPIMTEKELFRQVWCEYMESFEEFKADTVPKIQCAKTGTPAPMEKHGEDCICASCLPWLHFDSITQADYAFDQEIPILAWGKMEDGKIPISVKFNHCFMDGLHVSRFFEAIKQGFSEPESLLKQNEIRRLDLQ